MSWYWFVIIPLGVFALYHFAAHKAYAQAAKRPVTVNVDQVANPVINTSGGATSGSTVKWGALAFLGVFAFAGIMALSAINASKPDRAVASQPASIPAVVIATVVPHRSIPVEDAQRVETVSLKADTDWIGVLIAGLSAFIVAGVKWLRDNPALPHPEFSPMQPIDQFESIAREAFERVRK